MNDMERRGPAQRRRQTPEPKKKSKLPPIFMLIGLSVIIFCLFRFSPGANPQPKSTEMTRDDIQLFDQRVWTDSMTRSFTLYSEVKRTGYDLERRRVNHEDTLRYCEESLVFINDHRNNIATLAEQETRGNASAFAQACVKFFDAAREVLLALQAEAEKDPEIVRVSLADFEEKTAECDALIDDIRDSRITFLTPALTEQQLETTIDTMDTQIRSIK